MFRDSPCVGAYQSLPNNVVALGEHKPAWMVLPHRTPYPGGAPANVACALGKFGDRVVFVSALGDDDLGDQMLALLKGACCFPDI